jgi:methylphosphotriester-DNA--protein-cysteine methyltransferase
MIRVKQYCDHSSTKPGSFARLEFKGRRREVMAPDRWTELFFLDEATAFAGGHRPCFECRRENANRFKAAWLKGNPHYGFDHKTSIKKIDEVIHRERIDKNGEKVTVKRQLNIYPMVLSSTVMASLS